MDNVIDLDEYKRLLELKSKLDTGEITNDNILLEDLEKINQLYIYEINELERSVSKLKEENKRLKIIKGD